MSNPFVHRDQDTAFTHRETEQAGVRYLLMAEEPPRKGRGQRAPAIGDWPELMPRMLRQEFENLCRVF